MRRLLVGLAAMIVLAASFAPPAAVPGLALVGTVYGYGTANPCGTGAALCYWSPNRIVISAGDTVTWRVAFGTHGPRPQNTLGNRWPASCPGGPIGTAGYSCVFDAQGTYVYWCRVHGQAMTGSVLVVAPRAPVPVVQPSPIRLPSPSPSPSPGGANTSRNSPDPVVPTLIVLVAIVSVGIGVSTIVSNRRARR